MSTISADFVDSAREAAGFEREEDSIDRRDRRRVKGTGMG
jgi:hypothetical protein